MAHKLKIFCLWILLLPFLVGCASIAKGVTSAFLDKTEKEKDTRAGAAGFIRKPFTR
jgi:hypothetical protein